MSVSVTGQQGLRMSYFMGNTLFPVLLVSAVSVECMYWFWPQRLDLRDTQWLLFPLSYRVYVILEVYIYYFPSATVCLA